jgi:hypothetical protein
MNDLKIITNFFYNRDLQNSYLLEANYAEINELKIDELNSYKYKKYQYIIGEAWQFEDRCGNNIVAVYINSVGEFKTGYKIEGVDTLIFKPEDLENSEKYITPCPDDKRVNTVYKILITEVIPNYLLNKKPNRLFFNPVSDSRKRLVDMIINKVVKKWPELIKKGKYIINK